MKPNMVVSLFAGCVILVLGAGAMYGIAQGLEIVYAVMGDSMKYLIATPLVLVVAYLVGNGFLEVKMGGRK